MKILLIIAVLLTSIYLLLSAQHTGKVSGLLLLDLRRNHESFDLFLPCKIDTAKTLRNNLITLKTDTAFQTLNPNFELVGKGEKIRNERYDDSFAYNLQYCLVIPVVAEFDTDSEKLFKSIETNETLRMPYTFYGTTVIEYYRTKWAYLKSIKVITLPRN